MSDATENQPRQDIWVIIAAASVALALSFGARSVYGALMEPVSAELFGGRIEVFSLALAISNLTWGLGQPVFGAIADKVGDRLALMLGLACYVVGNVVFIYGTGPLAMYAGPGALMGFGVAGTAFGVVLAVVGRAAPTHKRSQYLGLVSALGSTGQVLMPFIGAELLQAMDWRSAVAIITVMLLPIAGCAYFLKAPKAEPVVGGAPAQGMWETVTEAFAQPRYVLLTLGFFVCGFHIAFITAHLPNFVEHFCTSTDMSAAELRGFGLQALSLVGFANIIGTFGAGMLGARIPKNYVLSAIYALRAVVIVLFISTPPTPTSILIFSFVMGLLWLSTVPLTSGLVLTMFGPRYMGTLYGFVFLGHQVGGFLGVWLGGVAFDVYQSYDAIWYAAIALGVFSAIVHLPVREAALGRESAA